MKLHPALAIAALLLIPATFAVSADDATPPELAAARERRNTAIKQQIKEIDENYIIKLTEMKKKAMASEKLELAIAIDREIKSIRSGEKECAKNLRDQFVGNIYDFLFENGGSLAHYQLNADGGVSMLQNDVKNQWSDAVVSGWVKKWKYEGGKLFLIDHSGNAGAGVFEIKPHQKKSNGSSYNGPRGLVLLEDKNMPKESSKKDLDGESKDADKPIFNK